MSALKGQGKTKKECRTLSLTRVAAPLARIISMARRERKKSRESVLPVARRSMPGACREILWHGRVPTAAKRLLISSAFPPYDGLSFCPISSQETYR